MSEQPTKQRFWNHIFGGPIEPETDQVGKLQEKLVALQDEMSAVRQEVRKLGKAQYKANMLADGQSKRWQTTADAFSSTQAENAALVQKLAQQTAGTARHDLLQAVLTSIDGVEQAILSGYSYLHQRDLQTGLQVLFPAEHHTLASLQDREVLAGWLSGLRLVRERLLAVLAQDGVIRIATVGRAFDPYLHVAVGTVSAETPADENQIASEQKAGYQSAHGVLRYAEVIVKKAKR